MSIVTELKENILKGGQISRDEALLLADAPLDELTRAADEIRRQMCQNGFDLCTIVNGKCGRCSEDCKYCAQSVHYHTACSESYPLLDTEKLLEGARYNEAKGVLRYSIVTSGKRLTDREIDQVCESIRTIKKETSIEVCVSFGLLNESQFRKIK